MRSASPKKEGHHHPVPHHVLIVHAAERLIVVVQCQSTEGRSAVRRIAAER
ncbi:MAG: hypothetical protein ABI380_01270 [Edaphobacter sp.]